MRGDKLSIREWEKRHKTFVRNVIIFLDKLEDERNAEMLNNILSKHGYDLSTTSALSLWFLMTILSPAEQAYVGLKKLDGTKAGKTVLSSEQITEILMDATKLQKKFSLGKEWQGSFINLLVNGWMIVPAYNFHFARPDGNTESDFTQSVVFLNSDTSFEDLREGLDLLSQSGEKALPKRHVAGSINALVNRKTNLLRSNAMRTIIPIVSMYKNISPLDMPILRDDKKAWRERIYIVNKNRKQRGCKPIVSGRLASPKEVIKTFFPGMKNNEIKRMLISARQETARRKKRDNSGR